MRYLLIAALALCACATPKSGTATIKPVCSNPPCERLDPPPCRWTGDKPCPVIP